MKKEKEKRKMENKKVEISGREKKNKTGRKTEHINAKSKKNWNHLETFKTEIAEGLQGLAQWGNIVSDAHKD